MIGTAAWTFLALLGVVLELAARRGARLSRLGSLGSKLAGRRIGRLALYLLWAFVGWHLFARYTVPPL